MSKILTVMVFELKSIFRKRSVLITTIIIAGAIFIATFIPTIINLFSGNDQETTGDSPVSLMTDIGFVFESDSLTYDELSAYFNSKLLVYEDEEALKKAINDETINNGYIISDAQTITSIVVNKDMYSATDQMIVNALQYISRNKALIAMNIDPAAVDSVSYVPIAVNEVILGKDASSSFILAYILMFAVYMLVIMYGAFVSTSVAREKDNRTMEILITSTSPKALIIGKVFANALGGLVQFGAVIAVGVIGYLINQNSYPEEIIQMVFAGLSWDAALVFILFTAVGYTLYLFLYASLGSLVSKVEDVGSSTTPITMLFMVGYLISAFALNMPKGILVNVGSYVPFSAILVMPIRYFLTSVPLIELFISIMLMALTTVFLAFVSIKIYRLGSLNYGNKISFIKAIKMIFAEDNIDLND